MAGPSPRRRLENDWEDVLNKAVRGAGMAASEIASAAGLSLAELRPILNGKLPPDSILQQLARGLQLRSAALLDIAHERYSPQPLDPKRWPGVAQVPSTCYDEIANAYLIWSPTFREAVLVDPSGHFAAIRKTVESANLQLKAVCITHAHGDHLGSLDEVMRAYHPLLFAPQKEPLPGARLIDDGGAIEVKGLRGHSVFINGHSPGHLAYVFEGGTGWPSPVALVGDVLFAGSMGYGNVSYARLRSNVRNRLLTLPPDTLLCPGHGPCSTVAEEREHNPFA